MPPPPVPPIPSASRTRRLLLVAAGSLCLALGAAGAVLPLLPTTPLVLLAAACFARSSPAFHRALRESRLFGPVLRDWEDHRSVSARVKWRAVAMVMLVFGLTIGLALEKAAPRTAMALLGAGLVMFLARLPVTPTAAVRLEREA